MSKPLQVCVTITTPVSVEFSVLHLGRKQRMSKGMSYLW
uniref:Uncharacterized protein n=1 Tax=Anguilla anguilla TaxID=7936 RepID=A0A0E9UM16_ANGAN